MDAKELQEAREKLAQKFASGGQIGGKGSVRRKKKTVHKAASMDDKRLQGTFKRLGLNTIPSIEEVNMFKDDSTIIHFDQPKVQASLQSNTYVVSGHAETKTMAEMLPSLLSQLGNNPNGLKMLTEQLARARVGGGAGGEDEDIPDLEGADFEAASK